MSGNNQRDVIRYLSDRWSKKLTVQQTKASSNNHENEREKTTPKGRSVTLHLSSTVCAHNARFEWPTPENRFIHHTQSRDRKRMTENGEQQPREASRLKIGELTAQLDQLSTRSYTTITVPISITSFLPSIVREGGIRLFSCCKGAFLITGRTESGRGHTYVSSVTVPTTTATYFSSLPAMNLERRETETGGLETRIHG